MRKNLYQRLYQILLFLSNHLNSKLIVKYKVLIGTSLLLLINACQMSKKNNSNFVTCYDPSPINEDTLEISVVEPNKPETSRYREDTTGMPAVEPPEPSCYVAIPDTLIEIPAVKPHEPIEGPELIVLCYDGGDPYELEPEPQYDENHVYTMVELMPDFPGGVQALSDYLEKSIRYPEKAKDEEIQGRVTVTFVVNKDGSVSDAKIVRSIDPMLDKEALRIINAMPSWKPGKLKDRVVRVQYTVPVRFRLDK